MFLIIFTRNRMCCLKTVQTGRNEWTDRWDLRYYCPYTVEPTVKLLIFHCPRKSARLVSLVSRTTAESFNCIFKPFRRINISILQKRRSALPCLSHIAWKCFFDTGMYCRCIDLFHVRCSMLDDCCCVQDLAQLQEATQCLISYHQSREIDPEAFGRLIYVARSVAAFRPTNLVLFAEKYFMSAVSGELTGWQYRQ